MNIAAPATQAARSFGVPGAAVLSTKSGETSSSHRLRSPPTKPSLGTLIRIGQDFLFAGEWWIVIFPGIALAILVLAVNLLGDWMRDAFNPKLR